jgi:hypothetical protein
MTSPFFLNDLFDPSILMALGMILSLLQMLLLHVWHFE